MSVKDVEEAIKHVRSEQQLHPDVRDWREWHTRYIIIDPVLWALGWNTHKTSDCEVEIWSGRKSAQGQADYALFNKDSTRVILIEAKRFQKSLTRGDKEQLKRYSYRIALGMGVLTNGSQWNIYCLSKRDWSSRPPEISVDILSDEPSKAARTLHRCLNRRKWW